VKKTGSRSYYHGFICGVMVRGIVIISLDVLGSISRASNNAGFRERKIEKMEQDAGMNQALDLLLPYWYSGTALFTKNSPTVFNNDGTSKA